MIKNKVAFFLMSIVIIAGVTLLMLPMEAFNEGIRKIFLEYSWLDKIAHFILFATLTTFLYLSVKFKRINLFMLMASAAAFAEAAQVFGLRTVSVFDAMANMTGVLSIYLISEYFKNKEIKKLKSDEAIAY